MKRKELFLVNTILFALIAGFGLLAVNLSLNHAPANDAVLAKTPPKETTMAPCSKDKPLTLQIGADINLKRLQDYQNLCHSFVTNKLMIFIGFSQDKDNADKDAAAMATKLKAFAASGVTPLVIAEPYIKDQTMSYKAYLSGAYDDGMNEYFAKLKDAGVTDQMMGTWVPFPESNTPSWNNKDTQPEDFALCVNKYLGKLKEYFPKTHGSVLLNATTYLPTDEQWDNGDYISLSPYVSKIDIKLVDSFGIQGFPWMSNAQQKKRTIFKASEFLQPDLAIGAAQVLRTRDIWINTGTFASKYTKDPRLTVHLSVNERKALLEGIIEVAKNIRDYQQNQYRVSINLFAKDKSAEGEATDWSYIQTVESQGVLRDFLSQAYEQDIPVSLFDEASWQLK